MNETERDSNQQSKPQQARQNSAFKPCCVGCVTHASLTPTFTIKAVGSCLCLASGLSLRQLSRRNKALCAGCRQYSCNDAVDLPWRTMIRQVCTGTFANTAMLPLVRRYRPGQQLAGRKDASRHFLEPPHTLECILSLAATCWRASAGAGPEGGGTGSTAIVKVLLALPELVAESALCLQHRDCSLEPAVNLMINSSNLHGRKCCKELRRAALQRIGP